MVAGFRIYEAVFGPQPVRTLLAAGCELEGHPENVAAALLGGLVACCQRADGSVIALRAVWPRALRIVWRRPRFNWRRGGRGWCCRRRCRSGAPSATCNGSRCSWRRCAAQVRGVGGGFSRLPASAQPVRHRALSRPVAGASPSRYSGCIPEWLRSVVGRRGHAQSAGSGRVDDRSFTTPGELPNQDCPVHPAGR